IKEDIVLAVIGEKSKDSGEAASRANIDLKQEDILLVESLKAVGKTVITIVFNGRPLPLTDVANNSDGLIEAWALGVEAGNALANILYGITNPSAKLTTTFPYTAGQCPVYYDHINTGRPATDFRFTSKHVDLPLEVQFPFGFGLSYSTYEYQNFTANCKDNYITAKVTIKNTGKFAGSEIVQFYFRDPVAGRVRPVQKLIGFKKIYLEPGEEKEVCFSCNAEAFGYYDQRMNYIVDKGEIELMVGRSSKDVDCVTVFVDEEM
ncbi:MAG: glycoside hydrolase family 3 C-terminal domain-containing protein, partial [Lachnospiraceae bacterium]|nr:glycoside hydrolase family 3 C-terminal domain-containing protein [Lachnospiraceae bacterium]